MLSSLASVKIFQKIRSVYPEYLIVFLKYREIEVVVMK